MKQDPEIEMMYGWLTSWGEEVSEDMSGREGHDRSSGMPGTMSGEDMDMPEKAD
ncbi:DUF305 domain-containing protein [Streptomyces europaeiscabiei]|uniref:DUF305 domain-containing protein n=1 Tax=Streptomyces europaeiscabiei TaxID=146819 RepID=UPI0029B5E8F8|nr:DUF305 domain-containing protein [Streptomyces europaeiscabiei]MDX3696705.1 DUF305 domain-containing protein [Streptomyces europaeiscabiei]